MAVVSMVQLSTLTCEEINLRLNITIMLNNWAISKYKECIIKSKVLMKKMKKC